LRELAFAKAPWDKWLTPELKARPRAELEKDEAVRLRITRVCGHYLFADPAIRAARERLYENVERFELTERGPEAFVAGRIEKAIDFYARHFRLEGLNSALAGEAAGG
jgi:hypothetical protein